MQRGSPRAGGTNHSLSENYLWKVDTNFRSSIKLTDGEFCLCGDRQGGGEEREGKTGAEGEGEARRA